MRNKDKMYDQRLRVALLVVMGMVIFGTTAMIITALLTLADLRNDIRQMNQQMYNFQQEIIRVRSGQQ
jgi:hypothetical protein